ncbi:MAG: FliM/FliN family flagellar motor switch protein [Sphingorhabdus sp.]|uniref:FliM/FliN family flagellar motor switch protein n=1 Tax=Sphingorhabdus sp. TaxID=1902408 RepID=UPI003C9ABD52
MDYAAWIPEKNITDVRLADPFVKILSEWIKHWLCSVNWAISDHWSQSTGISDCSAVAFEIKNGVSCYISERSKALISGAMLGLPLEKGKPQKADGHLVTAIAERALSELEARLATIQLPEQTIGSRAGAFEGPDDLAYEISMGGKIGPTAISLRANRGFLVRLAQSFAPAPRPLTVLADRYEAVRESEVSVGAKIGVARLKLSQVHELGIGDVIAFDGLVQSLVGITVNGTEALPSAFRVKTNENILELELMRSLS